METIQYRALRLVFNDFSSSYETPFWKSSDAYFTYE